MVLIGLNCFGRGSNGSLCFCVQ